ncbi:hypothetical protein [Cohnella terricola]|uniref:Uncharacterized protein n=1 Tax=Cohnella terricola TaxID=1289167 RepID=A0A559JQ53_9BACL|nr:hypothetical protein [Cohnella terricola]TVY02014.1 hypothetical protein FPZ45_06105 [Cohnella terricola]
MRSNHPAIQATTRSGTSKWLIRFFVFIILFGSMTIGLQQVKAPRPVGSEAHADQFSAARAMEKLREIAKEPHPVEYVAHDKVRDYLLSELDDMGLMPVVQQAVVTSEWDRSRTMSSCS